MCKCKGQVGHQEPRFLLTWHPIEKNLELFYFLWYLQSSVKTQKKARSCAMFFSRCTFDPSFLGKNYAKGSFNRLSLPVDMDGGELRGIVTTKLWQMYDIIIVYIIWLFYPILYIFKEFFLESSVYPPTSPRDILELEVLQTKLTKSWHPSLCFATPRWLGRLRLWLCCCGSGTLRRLRILPLTFFSFPLSFGGNLRFWEWDCTRSRLQCQGILRPQHGIFWGKLQVAGFTQTQDSPKKIHPSSMETFLRVKRNSPKNRPSTPTHA